MIPFSASQVRGSAVRVQIPGVVPGLIQYCLTPPGKKHQKKKKYNKIYVSKMGAAPDRNQSDVLT